MKNVFAKISAISSWVPDCILSNQDLSKAISKSSDWIEARTGIIERHILSSPNTATSDMAVNAIKKLQHKSNFTLNEVDVIICATITPDMPLPSTACIIAEKIGASNAFCFDINAACGGFIYALSVASNYIESNHCKSALVIAADKMSSIVDYTNINSIIFGDGAGVVLLEQTNEPIGVLDFMLKSGGDGVKHLHIKAGGSLHPASQETITEHSHSLFMNGSSVFKAAVEKMTTVTQSILNKNKLTVNDVNWFVPHQANKRIIDAVGKNLNFPEEKIMCNIKKYGNTSAATIPLCLDESENQLKTEDLLLLTAFGAGYVWGSLLLKWAYNSSN